MTSDQGYNGIERFVDLAKLSRAGVSITSRSLIPSVPLAHLLARSNMQHVDFFSLDTEGAELQVLRSINFEATTFGVLLVEDEGSHEEFTTLLEGHGYFLYARLGHNDYLWANACLFRRSSLAAAGTTSSERYRRLGSQDWPD